MQWYQIVGYQPHNWIEWLNAISTVVIALFAVVTCIAVWCQVKTAQGAERAWIVVDVTGEYAPADFGDAAIWLVSPHVRNNGRTPARILKMALNLNPIPSGSSLPVEPKYRNEHSWEIIHPPGQSFQPLNEGVVKTDILQVAGGLESLYLCGFVKYEDVWKNKRETRFCFLYHHFSRADEPRSGFYLEPEVPEAYTRCS